MRASTAIALLVAILAVAGCGDDDAVTTVTATSQPTGPTTSAEEAAEVQAAVDAYQVVFRATSKRAKECERLDAQGIENYDDCFIRSVRQPNDEAGTKLAQKFAALEASVDPECARVLAQEAKDATDVVTAGDPSKAARVCQPTE